MKFMMVENCSVPGCKSIYNPKKKVCMHGFPKGNEVLVQQWIKAISRKNWYPSKHTKICGKHFEENDYISVCSHRLKSTAVPSRLLPISKECHHEGNPIIITQTTVERTPPQKIDFLNYNPMVGTSNQRNPKKIHEGTQTPPLKLKRNSLSQYEVLLKKRIKTLQKAIQRRSKKITNLLEELKKLNTPFSIAQIQNINKK